MTLPNDPTGVATREEMDRMESDLESVSQGWAAFDPRWVALNSILRVTNRWGRLQGLKGMSPMEDE